jgi:hypothetical protein
LVVSTGADGRMRPGYTPLTPGNGLTAGRLPTSQAVRRFGELELAGTAAALHLTS